MSEYQELMTNGAHWLFEISTDIVLGFIFYPLGKILWGKALRRHDAEFHPESLHDHGDK